MVGSLYSICGMWTVYLYCFLFLIMQKSLENIYHPNIVTKGFPRLKKILLYPGLSKVNLLSVEINIKKVENSKKLFTD